MTSSNRKTADTASADATILNSETPTATSLPDQATSVPSTPVSVRPRGRARAVALASAAAGLVMLGASACGGGGRTDPETKDPEPLPSPTSTRQEMGEKNLGYTWPLTIDHGTAECREGDQAVFTVPNGTTYALNDRARQAGYRNISAIRASGDDGDKVSLGSLLSRTMKLCRPTR